MLHPHCCCTALHCVGATRGHSLALCHVRVQVLFSRELARRLAAAGVDVDVLAVHPGNVLTDVVRSLPAAVQRAYRALMARVLLTPEQGGPCREQGLDARHVRSFLTR